MKNVYDNSPFLFDKNTKKAFVLLLGVSICVPVYAATATATATANITSTMTVRTINGLFFGDLSAGAESGTLELSPGGTRTTTGGVTVNSAIAGSPAAFDVQGDPNSTYSITFPAAIVMSNGSPNSMVVDKFTSLPEATGVIDASGQQTLYVGATLNVDSNQAFGTYSGELNVTVDYH
jgi:hypothetical protein